MEIKTINLSELYGIGGTATLKCFLHKGDGEMAPYNQNLPAMIAVPGGGYHFVSEREGDPVAVEFFNRHYNAFTLVYDVAPTARYPLALTELACAVDYIKSNAEELHVNPKRVFATGFSAGGHLVGCLANFYKNLPVAEVNGKKLNAAPTGVVLGYPVITPDTHGGSFKNLLGVEDVHCEKAEALSLEKTVTPDNPPCFIWTTAEDSCVDPMATVLYTTELLKNKVTVESHIFPYGWHGSSVGDERVYEKADAPLFERTRVWTDMADKFLASLPDRD